MDATYEFCFFIQSNDALYKTILVNTTIRLAIIPNHIRRFSIVIAITTQEKIFDILGIFKPLIIIQKKKPVTGACMQAGISRCSKVITPLKFHYLVCIFLYDFQHFLITTGIYNDQFTWDGCTQMCQGIQALTYGIFSVGCHQRDAEFQSFCHISAPLFFYYNKKQGAERSKVYSPSCALGFVHFFRDMIYYTKMLLCTTFFLSKMLIGYTFFLSKMLMRASLC